MPFHDADIVKIINLLFDMMAEAQEKAFRPIVKQAASKRLKSSIYMLFRNNPD